MTLTVLTLYLTHHDLNDFPACIAWQALTEATELRR